MSSLTRYTEARAYSLQLISDKLLDLTSGEWGLSVWPLCSNTRTSCEVVEILEGPTKEDSVEVMRVRARTI